MEFDENGFVHVYCSGRGEKPTHDATLMNGLGVARDEDGYQGIKYECPECGEVTIMVNIPYRPDLAGEKIEPSKNKDWLGGMIDDNTTKLNEMEDMTTEIQTPDGTLTVTTDPEESTAYVTSITVSTEQKRSDGDYGSDTHFASETIQLSPAVALDDNGPVIVETMDKARHLLDCHLNNEEEHK